MSGGYFDYKQHGIHRLAVEIDHLIKENEWTDKRIPEKFKKASHYLKKASAMVQRIDWYLSGDDGGLNFLHRWEEEGLHYP